MTSILGSIKQLLGIEQIDTAFDQELIMHINAEFMTLAQLGIGPKNGYSISSINNTWSEFSTNTKLIDAVCQYIYLKVKLIFDPPGSTTISDAYRSRASELEWRLLAQAEGDAETT